MVIPNDTQERTQRLLQDALPMLCRSGLGENTDVLKVDALIGITLSNQEVILVNIKTELSGDDTAKNITSKRRRSDATVENGRSKSSKNSTPKDSETRNNQPQATKSFTAETDSKKRVPSAPFPPDFSLNPPATQPNYSFMQKPSLLRKTNPSIDNYNRGNSITRPTWAIYPEPPPYLAFPSSGYDVTPKSQQSITFRCFTPGCTASFLDESSLRQHSNQCHGSGVDLNAHIQKTFCDPKQPSQSSLGSTLVSSGYVNTQSEVPYVVSIKPATTTSNTAGQPAPVPKPHFTAKTTQDINANRKSWDESDASIQSTHEKPEPEKRPKKFIIKDHLSSSQYNELIRAFNTTAYPTKGTFEELANSFGIPETNIRTWFVNKRNGLKKKGKPMFLVKLEPSFHQHTPVAFTKTQHFSLKSVFNKTQHPSSEVKEKLAKELSLDLGHINYWFRTQRMKARKLNSSQRGAGRKRAAPLPTRQSPTSSAMPPTTVVTAEASEDSVVASQPVGAKPQMAPVISHYGPVSMDSVGTPVPSITSPTPRIPSTLVHGDGVKKKKKSPVKKSEPSAKAIEFTPPDLSQFHVLSSLPDLPPLKTEDVSPGRTLPDSEFIDLTSSDNIDELFPL